MIAGSIDVLDIPGHHFQAFDEQNVSLRTLLVSLPIWSRAADEDSDIDCRD